MITYISSKFRCKELKRIDRKNVCFPMADRFTTAAISIVRK